MEKHQSNTQQEKKTSSKKCTCCGKYKPLDEFSLSRNSPDNLQYICKPCDNEKHRQHSEKKPEYRLLSKMKERSVKKKFKEEVEWTLEEIREKIRGCCEVTGLPFDNIPAVGVGNRNPFKASPDRIDNSKGYSKENTRWVLLIVNLMRFNFPDAKVKQFIEHLRNNEINL